MAEIAVRHKRAMPGWAYGALFLLAIAFLALAFYLKNRPAPGDDVRSRSAEAPLTSVAALSSPDTDALVGRPVAIRGARVLSVTGDRVFWIAGDQARQILVILDEQRTPNMPHTEGRYDVNAGQILNIEGTVQRYPGWAEAQAQWNADPAYRSEFDRQVIYIHAGKLDITQRP